MTACRVALLVFVLLYLLALAVLVIGIFGLFGADRDPLSGIFLLPLGLPWNLATGAMPDALRPWLAVGAPAVNAVLLAALCGALRRRRR